ncbi:MAG: ABC transporter substrate-binding protein [Deltaproteobacteria bacterium]|nr:ABC transporter substrate-binding protein [Deltaproteobacteria bacterium]
MKRARCYFVGGLLLSFIFMATTLINTPAWAQTTKTGGYLTIIIPGTTGKNIGYTPEPFAPRDILMIAPCLETLLHYDKKGEQIPWLVTSWKWNPDWKSLTLDLRKGVKFHDGTDFNAEAVKYNLELIIKSPKEAFKSVKSIDVIDNYSLRLNFDTYDGSILPALSQDEARMISPTAVEKNGKGWASVHPVGTGPFKFKEFRRDSLLQYEKFEDYWQEGKPYLEGIEFKLIANKVTARMSFEAGEGKMIVGLQANDTYGLKQEGKYIVNTSFSSGISGLVGDGANPDSVFRDVRVRKAMAYAINREDICKNIFHDLNLPGHVLAVPGSKAYNPSVEGYSYDPAKAMALLKEAGYGDSNKPKIKLNVASVFDYTWVVACQGYLNKVGFDAQMELLAYPKYTAIRSTEGWKNGTCWISIRMNQLTEPSRAIQRAYTDFIKMIRPPELETTLNNAMNEPDPSKARALYMEAQRLMVDKYCILAPVYLGGQNSITYPEVKDTGLYIDFGNDQWTPEDIWLSK